MGHACGSQLVASGCPLGKGRGFTHPWKSWLTSPGFCLCISAVSPTIPHAVLAPGHRMVSGDTVQAFGGVEGGVVLGRCPPFCAVPLLPSSAVAVILHLSKK